MGNLINMPKDLPEETKQSSPKRDANGNLKFEGFPTFRPNLSPSQIFQMGSFGGTYWRPIYSTVTKTDLKDVHKQYPEDWFKGIPQKNLTRSWHNYDKSVNKY